MPGAARMPHRWSRRQVVQQLTDTSGALIEVTRDTAGSIVNLRVLRQATGGQ